MEVMVRIKATTGGAGQGTTTYEFGDSQSLTLYSGAGGGGAFSGGASSWWCRRWWKRC